MDKECAGYVYICSGTLLSHKENEILSLAAMWMGLKNTLLSEISQRKINAVWYHFYVESKKIIQMNIYANHKKYHKYRKKKPNNYQRGEREIRGMRLSYTNYYV